LGLDEHDLSPGLDKLTDASCGRLAAAIAQKWGGLKTHCIISGQPRPHTRKAFPATGLAEDE
jgi:hypothetical protein